MTLRIGSLFSGYGGLDLAVQSIYDAEHAWFCEFDDAPSSILAERWPDVTNHRDVTTADWSTVEPVDILTGGFPCQDVSVAGRRAGMTDGTRSGLWSHMAHAIDVLRPQLVVIENVGGLFSAEATSTVEQHPLCMGDDGSGRDTVPMRALPAVLSTLSELGYDAEWTSLRASDVGAPHGRLRVFITAHPAEDPSGGRGRGWPTLPLAGGMRGADAPPHGADDRPNAPGSPAGVNLLPTPSTLDSIEARTTYGGGNPTLQGAVGGVSDVDKARHERAGRLLPTPTAQPEAIVDPEVRAARVERSRAKHGRPFGESLSSAVGQLLPMPRATDGTKGGPNQAGSSGDLMLPSAVQPERFGPYAPAIERWESIVGRPAPDPTEPGKTRPRLSARFVEWMMGLSDGHVTAVPGLTRNQQLKALGNGVVPQQGAAALQHLHELRESPSETSQA